MVESNKSQVVERTCSILREVARYGLTGARLIDVTQSTNLSRPSVHRILSTLVSEGFVSQTDKRRYRLTSLVYELGLSAPSPVSNLELLRPIIQNLANVCGDTAYLALREGDHALYLARGEGSYPIRAHEVHLNQSLNLVAGFCGRALLSELPENEVEGIIERAAANPDLFNNTTPDELRDEINLIRENGYGWSRDVTLVGIAGLTMTVPNPNGSAYLAVSIASIPQRLTKERAIELIPLMKETVTALRGVIDGQIA